MVRFEGGADFCIIYRKERLYLTLYYYDLLSPSKLYLAARGVLYKFKIIECSPCVMNLTMSLTKFIC